MDRRTALQLITTAAGMFGISFRMPAQSSNGDLQSIKSGPISSGIIATLSPEYEPEKPRTSESDGLGITFRQPDYSKPQTLTLYLDKINIVVDCGGNAKKITGRELFDAL